MFTIKQPVLVAVKLDQDAIAIIRQANVLAEAHGVSLYIGHVLPELVLVRPLFPQLHVPEMAQQSQMEAEALDRLGEITLEALGERAASAELVLEHGTPHAGLHRMAERLMPGLIVVGGNDHRHPFGSVAARIAREARCPVLIARRNTSSGAVVAATDFSDPALPGVEAGSAEAKRRDCPLFVLNCFDLFPVPPMSEAFVASLPSEYSAGLRTASRVKLEECAARFSAQALFQEGNPGISIVAAPIKWVLSSLSSANTGAAACDCSRWGVWRRT